MKKITAMCLTVCIFLMLAVAPAMADGDLTAYAFGFTASTNGSTLTHADQWHTKQGTCSIIQVRHNVIGSGSSAGHTNLMYACVSYVDGITYVGSKWQKPNGIYYSCTSTSLLQYTNADVVPGGRANTKYKEQNGLNSIRIEGQFRPH